MYHVAYCESGKHYLLFIFDFDARIEKHSLIILIHIFAGYYQHNHQAGIQIFVSTFLRICNMYPLMSLSHVRALICPFKAHNWEYNSSKFIALKNN